MLHICIERLFSMCLTDYYNLTCSVRHELCFDGAKEAKLKSIYVLPVFKWHIKIQLIVQI